MNLSQLSSKQISGLIKLVRKKETLLAQLSVIEDRLAALGGDRKPGRPAAVTRGGRRRAGGGRRGKLKAKILRALKGAGSRGVKVGDLSKKLKVPSNNVFSWFYTTGRTFKNIKKVGPATYAIVK